MIAYKLRQTYLVELEKGNVSGIIVQILEELSYRIQNSILTYEYADF